MATDDRQASGRATYVRVSAQVVPVRKSTNARESGQFEGNLPRFSDKKRARRLPKAEHTCATVRSELFFPSGFRQMIVCGIR